MRKILILALTLLPFYAICQEFGFGEITSQEKDFNRTQIDSTANAVYLNEYGTTRFSYDSETGRVKLVFDYHVRIKIFNKEGFEAANVIVPLHRTGTNDDQKEFLSDLKASTFNFLNGRLVETQMSSKAVFTEERSKYTHLSKFTLPNVAENSIIEYKYTIETPYIFNFRTWQFQSEYPKLNSTYVAFIPANYKYNISLRGYYPLTENKAELSTACLRISGKEMDCSKITYSMKNIPAFVEEDYMTSPSNYKSAVYFELSEVYYLTGSVQKYTKTWKDVENELIDSKEFGSQMKRKDVFKTIVPGITTGLTSDLQKAKAIFEYIKKQVRWNDYYGKYCETSVKEVVDKRSGNVADINFTLISALSAANLDVEAVILSTRDNGVVNKLYPILSDFNYVIAKVNIDGNSYLLDATEPLAPFGLLPLRCINDQGRVINLKKPSYWIDLKASKRSSTSHSLIGKMNEDGKINATVTSHSLGFNAMNLRKDMKRYSSLDEYVEKLDERLTNIKIKNYKIANVDSVENALVQEYEVELNVGNTENTANYFNPFFINPIRSNPFKLNQRNYPVDLGAASEERIAISISLPEKFQIKEQPKDISLALPNQGGRYILQTSLTDHNLTLSQQLLFSKAIYSPEEYHYLKEFYNRIIQTQKSDILLTKSN
ncbi:DUF3857 domain-containing protein [Pedobacter chitinilyticus]|uniref:DUF3857 domain-containing protein n=1 Tax=Pedobacter chitinilyticus TaxID=2233776 RepID=A0A443Z1K8_9SPHI|nr:DUF3857 domain-containing protein [Pedobacter chitinilyticus]RWU10421.1 DUF3857 domain-containing protein [Pedobacter chitinilyticus]